MFQYVTLSNLPNGSTYECIVCTSSTYVLWSTYVICRFDNIQSKDICSITYLDCLQTYRLTVAGEYANRNICSATVVTPSPDTMASARMVTFAQDSYQSGDPVEARRGSTSHKLRKHLSAPSLTKIKATQREATPRTKLNVMEASKRSEDENGQTACFDVLAKLFTIPSSYTTKSDGSLSSGAVSKEWNSLSEKTNGLLRETTRSVGQDKGLVKVAENLKKENSLIAKEMVSLQDITKKLKKENARQIKKNMQLSEVGNRLVEENASLLRVADRRRKADSSQRKQMASIEKERDSLREQNALLGKQKDLLQSESVLLKKERDSLIEERYSLLNSRLLRYCFYVRLG